MNLPKEIKEIIEKLQKNNFRAYLVGGCVRDLLLGLSNAEGLGRQPKDWDIATDAKPEEIQKFFPESVYENQFGTVGVKTDSEEPTLKVVEVTTFRKEGKYTDKRHPDEIKFAKTIEEDLSRRDFTINAIALAADEKIIDPYGGQEDLKKKILRTVGKAKERFNEDALRLMRAVRLATELRFSAGGGPASGWEIENETAAAIKQEAGFLEMIAKERIRDELTKIIMTKDAMRGIQLLEDFGLLRFIVPELREGIGVGQNKHHIYTVWEHNLRSLDYAAKKDYSLLVRTAALFHDVGKPQTKRGEGLNSTFYGHEILGAKMTLRILDRLRFSKEFTEKVAHLVRYHLFYYNVGEVTEAGVRRFLNRVGPENVADLIKVREADRIGSGVPKAVPYKLRHLLFMIEKVKRDPISPKMLAVNGDEVMKIAGIAAGPRVGWILAILLDEVLEEPKRNTENNLELKIQELGKLADEELKRLAGSARGRKDEFESGIEEEMKKKYYVK